MANVKKFLYLDDSGLQKQQTELDTIAIADGVASTDAVNKGQLDAALSTATSSVAAEEARALAAEAALQAAIDGVASDLSDEIARATAAEQAIAADLAAEVTARESAITSLNSSLSADILAEQTRAQAAETELAQDILDEKTRAEGVEADLQSQITSEITARESAVTSLNNTLSADITSEESARIAADTALQAAIDAEESARIAAVAGVQSSLDAEIARATAAEGVLTAAISAEEAARIAAVSAEQARAEAAEAGLDSDIIAETAARVAAVSAEESARIAGDAALQTALDAEEAARIAGDAATLADAKEYADTIAAGITYKNSVRVALPWEFELAGTSYTLPADFSSLVGMTDLTAGDRVLIVNSDSDAPSVFSGIYVVATGGTTLVRASDMAVGSDASGAWVYVEEGVVGSNLPFVTPGTSFICSNLKGNDIVGTAELEFVVFNRAEALSFVDGLQKVGNDVSLALKAGAPFAQSEGLELLTDGVHVGVVDGAVTVIGDLVGGHSVSADELHAHKHASMVVTSGVAAGAFCKPDGTAATWDSPQVLGFVTSEGASAGEKVVILTGLADSGFSESALTGFSVGDMLFLGGTAGAFVAFSSVPSGKYAVPVGRKVADGSVVIQIGGSPTLKA
jgi:hypothetical protein